MMNWRIGLAAISLASVAGNAFGQAAFGNVDKPDVMGGYPSDYILVRFERGINPFNSPLFGPQTGNPQLDLLTAKWRVSVIEARNPDGYADEALADQLGLTRSFLLRVEKGTNVKQMVRDYNRIPEVDLAELDGIGGVALTPNDPQIANCWGLNNTGQTGGTTDADVDAFEAWDTFTGYGNVTLAVLDTGVDGTHPEMAGKMIAGWNTNNNSSDTMDRFAHGTHCAGTAGANGNNGIGLAGMSWRVKIMPVKVLTDGGSGTEAQCGAGMVWAADHGANICSMSLQYYTGTSQFDADVNYAFGRGVCLIAATGNNRGRVIAWPARFANCYAIGATNHFDQRASFSNYGPEIDVTAPGENVYSCVPNNGYAYYSGTSMATPHTSGLASLLWSFDRGLTNTELFSLIRDYTDDKGSAGWDEEFGTGRINARSSMNRAMQDVFYASQFQLVRGNYTGGDLESAKHADGNYYTANGTVVPQSVPIPVQFLATGFSPRLTTSKLQFLVQSKVNKSGVTQRLELMVYATQTWETVDVSVAQTSDNLTIVSITNNPGRFLAPDGSVFSRTSFVDANPTVGPLSVSVDQARWSVRQ